MLEVAITGGGLCGLALARALHAEGSPFHLFEGRDRLGGRVLSVPTESAARLDLGAGWFWPQSHPHMAVLIEQLGLESFEQYDHGTLMSLSDPEKAATEAQIEPVHSGARRLSGGMGCLIGSLAASLPPGSVHLQHVLRRVTFRDDHVELQFHHGAESLTVRARRAVLAMPPRLIAEQVVFDPPLSEARRTALASTPTWMATTAKVAVRYEWASWRTGGRSGSAFVHHEQAVLGEIFDACDATGSQAALGGFLALSPQQRRDFRVGLPILISNQIEQVFGAQAGECGQDLQDWAEEPFTCSHRDLSDRDAGATAPEHAAPMLRLPEWQSRLYFGGSETAAVAGGYLEGALVAAERIHQDMRAQSDRSCAVATTGARSAAAMPPGVTSPAARSRNDARLAEFARWVALQREPAFESYRRRLNAGLALRHDQLTQRAVLEAMEQVFHAAVEKLRELSFDTREVRVEHGRSALTPQVQSAFRGFIDDLLLQVARFNRASCALSNFPQEHEIATDYRSAMLRDIGAAWREFCVNANSVLLGQDTLWTRVPATAAATPTVGITS